MIKSKEEALRLLGLSATASKQDVREAYRCLSKMLHPDNSIQSEVNPRFYEINEAYEYLMNHWEETSYGSKIIRGAGERSYRSTSGPRVFGDSISHFRQEEHRKDLRKKREFDERSRQAHEQKLKQVLDEGKAIRERKEEEERKKESVMRAMKSIKAILAARVIEDYLDQTKK